jgi:hypothetical protein
VTAALAVLTALAFGCVCFVAGSAYEATRKGGSQDLAAALRTKQHNVALHLMEGNAR